MGCIQSKPSKRQGLFQQQEEIISRQVKDEEIIRQGEGKLTEEIFRQGNNNKDDSEKVKMNDGYYCQDSVNSRLLCCC